MVEQGRTLMGGNQSKYHAVVVPDDGEPLILTADSPEGLAQELKGFYGTRSYAFPFYGEQWFISRGPTQRLLLGPTGERIPLFDEEPNHEPDPQGSLNTREDTYNEKVR